MAYHQDARTWSTPQTQRSFANVRSRMCWQLSSHGWRTENTHTAWTLSCIASPPRASTVSKCHRCLLHVLFGDPASTALSCLPNTHVQKGCSARAVIYHSLELMATSSTNVNRGTFDYWRDMPLYWRFRGFLGGFLFYRSITSTVLVSHASICH